MKSLMLLIVLAVAGCDGSPKPASPHIVGKVHCQSSDAPNGITAIPFDVIHRLPTGDIHFRDAAGKWYTTNGYMIEWTAGPQFSEPR